MEVICLDEPAFYALIDKVVIRLELIKSNAVKEQS